MYLKDIILKATTQINICKENPKTKCGFPLQFADSTYNLRIPLTVADSATAQINDTKFYHLLVDSSNCSGFRKYNCGFRKFAYFLSNFERYNDLGIGLWNPKQHRRSEKSSNVADSAVNLILACCGFRLQCRECTVWPRNVLEKLLLSLKTKTLSFNTSSLDKEGSLKDPLVAKNNRRKF